MFVRYLCAFISALISVQPISAQQLTQSQIRMLDSIATQDVPPQAPGIATAIIKNGEVVYEKYAGFANLSDSALIGKRTRFNIASNGKQFTALAVLLLVNEKKIKLIDDIRKYIPSLLPGIKTGISVHHLLTHSSGIRDIYDLWSLQGIVWWKNSFSNRDVLALLEKQRDLNFKPGSRYMYSNSNYILLALMIEKVTGRTFIEYTRDMFEKLGMPNTYFVDEYKKIGDSIARAYFNFSTWTSRDWVWNACGDGNIFSTLEDQIQWEKILQGKSVTPLGSEIIEKSQQPLSGSSIKSYGYGLEFGKYKHRPYKFHEGATGAWKATVIRFPGERTSFITLTNTGKSIPYSQTRQMADIFFNLKPNDNYFITHPAQIGKYVDEQEILGTYLTEDNFSFEFVRIEEKIFLRRNGRNDVELQREANNIFHQKNDPVFKQEFLIDRKGKMTVTAYYNTHAPYTLTRPLSDWNGFRSQTIVGKYINEETNTVLEIRSKEDRKFSLKLGSRDFAEANLVTPSRLLFNSYAIQIDMKSGVPILFLDGERIKKLKFSRVN